MEILTAAERGSDLVKQILTFSRQSREEQRPVRVKPLIKEALKLLRSSLPTTIEIHQYLESGESVLADPTHIHQIVMNLCTNAAHAMEEDGGILEVSLSQCHSDEEQCRHADSFKIRSLSEAIGWADSGTGMPSDIVKQIFDPFFTTKEIGRGTGLGLSVVHGIVKNCGGEITVKSQPGSGSVFTVYLPVLEQQWEEEVKNNETPLIGE